jgi:hypothetical protein
MKVFSFVYLFIKVRGIREPFGISFEVKRIPLTDVLVRTPDTLKPLGLIEGEKIFLRKYTGEYKYSYGFDLKFRNEKTAQYFLKIKKKMLDELFPQGYTYKIERESTYDDILDKPNIYN